MCEETASFDLTSFDIASCIEDVAQCIEFVECREHNELDVDEGTGNVLLQSSQKGGIQSCRVEQGWGQEVKYTS